MSGELPSLADQVGVHGTAGVDPARSGAVGDGPGDSAAARWQFRPSAHDLWGSPALHDGTVYVGAYEESALYAVDVDSGDRLWRCGLPGTVDAGPVVADLPADADAGDGEATGPTVFVGAGQLCAVDADSGDRVWTGTETGAGTPASDGLAVAGGSLLAVHHDRLARVDAQTGDRTWETIPEQVGTLFGSPVGAGKGVLVQRRGGLSTLLAPNGVEHWRVDLPGTATPPALCDGTVYVATDTDRLLAIDLAGGDTDWTLRSGPEAGPDGLPGDGLSTPVAVDPDGPTAYVGGPGRVHAVAPDGAVRWSSDPHALGDDVPEHLAVTDEAVYVTTTGVAGDGRAYALDAATGDCLWSVAVGRVRGRPVVGDGTMLLVADDALVALGPGDA